MIHQPINRYLEDKWMDHMDHALGRPLDPTGETYRNFYSTSGELADRMAASPYWQEGRRGTQFRNFAVSDEGRKALAAHLREIGDSHRAYIVSFNGYNSTVIAKSPTKAKYDYYLRISDVWSDLTFKEFCRNAKVHVAMPKVRRAANNGGNQ